MTGNQATQQAPGPDCEKCIYKPTCERAIPGTFCTMYRSQALPPRKEEDSPAARWARGEDVDI